MNASSGYRRGALSRHWLSEDHRRRHRQGAQDERGERLSLLRFQEAINEAVAERVTAAVRARMAAIARADRPAGERLRDLLRAMNACMCELGVSEAKMHDMVEAAMNESWGVISAHIAEVDQIITGVVADGVASGEFDADPKISGPCIRAAMIRFCHPAIIAQCHDMPLPTLEQQVEFVLAAVRTTLDPLSPKGPPLFLRLLQAIFRPPKVQCKHCGRRGPHRNCLPCRFSSPCAHS